MCGLGRARQAGILEKMGTDTRTRTRGHGQTDRRTLLTDSYDGQLWKRRTFMEKTGSYGKDGQLWKRRAVMEKTDSCGKEGHKAFTYKKPRILIRLA